MKNEIQFRCVLPNGIHARPASHLEKVCGQFQSQINLTNLRNGNTADAKSILALVGTDTLMNDDFILSFDGEDSQQAIAILSDYINNEFPPLRRSPRYSG